MTFYNSASLMVFLFWLAIIVALHYYNLVSHTKLNCTAWDDLTGLLEQLQNTNGGGTSSLLPIAGFALRGSGA